MESATDKAKDGAWRSKASTRGWTFDLVQKAMRGAGLKIRELGLEREARLLKVLSALSESHTKDTTKLIAINRALVKGHDETVEKLRAEIREVRQASVRSAEEAFAESQALERRLVRLEAEIAKKKR